MNPLKRRQLERTIPFALRLDIGVEDVKTLTRSKFKKGGTGALGPLPVRAGRMRICCVLHYGRWRNKYFPELVCKCQDICCFDFYCYFVVSVS